MTRSGFIALAGRPNVGKSTLVNRIAGEKVAIVSERPQTTRRALRGIATVGEAQLVLVDLPGTQRPRDVLTERMQRRVEAQLADTDAALLVIDAQQGVGPGDRFTARAIASAGATAVIAVNKVDRLGRSAIAAALASTAKLGLDAEVFPISAREGTGVEALVEELAGLVPEGHFLYPPGETTDLAEPLRFAELIREQVLARTREELPHAVEVEVEAIERGDALVRVEALVWAESESQKRILIGTGGRMVKAVGTAARKQIEALTGAPVHLDLRVRVRRDWRRDDALLDRLGIE